jgi:hypothetical protein
MLAGCIDTGKLYCEENPFLPCKASNSHFAYLGKN